MARKSEERKYTRAKCLLCFFNDLWVGWVESRLGKAAGAEVAV